MNNSDVFDITWALKVIRRWLWLIALCAILAAGIAYTVISIMPPTYKASVTLLIEPAADNQSTTYSNLVAGQQLAITYGQMITARQTLQSVINQLNLEITPENLAEKITIEAIRDTQLIQVTVSNSDPQQARRIANTLADAFITHVQTIQQTRYQAELKNTQDRIDTNNAQIQAIQAKIDALNLQKINQQVELDHLNTLLSGYQDDYRSLYQNALNLQGTIAQTTSNIYIAQPAYSKNHVATVSILVGQSPITSPANSTNAILDQVTQSYYQLLINGPALNTAISQLGLSTSPDRLAESISLQIVPGTNIINLNVFDPDPKQAELLANAISAPFVDQIKSLLNGTYSSQLSQLQTQMDSLTSQINQIQADIKTKSAAESQSEVNLARLQNDLTEYRSDLRTYQQQYEQARLTAASGADTITISDPAQAPDRPTQNRLLYTALAFIVGAFLGLALAFLLEIQDNRVKTSQDVTGQLGLSILGTISHLPWGNNELVMCSEPRSNAAEEFRILSTVLRFAGHAEKPLQTILITSPTPVDGKTLVTANLAVALAKTGLRVTVVDADLHRPRMHNIFQVKNEDGLAEYLLNKGSNSRPQPTSVDGLNIITSGSEIAESASLLTSPSLNVLLDDLSHRTDIVLIDCPPVMVLADAAILASRVDGVILVLRAGRSETPGTKDAVKYLKQVRANIVGVVLNDYAGQKQAYHQYYRNNDGQEKETIEEIKKLERIG